jgi:hypothetical protein
LAKRRIDTIEQFIKMLLELCGDISPFTRGIKALQIKEQGLFPEEIEHAKKVRNELDSMMNFMLLNQIVLGKKS